MAFKQLPKAVASFHVSHTQTTGCNFSSISDAGQHGRPHRCYFCGLLQYL